MDTRSFFVLGFLCATTSGFIPHFSRRDGEAAQTAQGSDALSVARERYFAKSLMCRSKSLSCAPIRTMVDSMFRVDSGRMFIVNNQLTFSCSAETKAEFYVCASTSRKNCTGHTNWIDGFISLYEDLCAMEPMLLENAACMNSLQVTSTFKSCTKRSSDVCQSIVPCIPIAFDSEPSCTLPFKAMLTEAVHEMLRIQFRPC